MTSLPLSHPDRIDGGFRPLKAWRHFRQLIADNTDQPSLGIFGEAGVNVLPLNLALEHAS